MLKKYILFITKSNSTDLSKLSWQNGRQKKVNLQKTLGYGQGIPG